MEESKLNSEKQGYGKVIVKIWKIVSKLNSEKIWKIWKKSKLNEMIQKIWKKSKLNSEIWIWENKQEEVSMEERQQ